MVVTLLNHIAVLTVWNIPLTILHQQNFAEDQ